MSVGPYGRLKVGVRAAFRRRKGYAALRRVRAAVKAAVALHRLRSLDPTHDYAADAEMKKLRALYNRTVRRLRERWPALSLFDPRAEP